MLAAFYIAAFIAVLTTVLTITRSHPVHALIFLILSLLSVAFIFYLLGAPFIAALEVITYAGAIMVLFVFVVMLLHPGPQLVQQEKSWQHPAAWIGAASIAAVLLVELLWAIHHFGGPRPAPVATEISPQQLGMALYGPYLLGVEMASVLLLSALVGAWHIGRRHLLRERHDVLESRTTTHPTGPGPGGDSVLAGSDRPPRAP